MANNENNAEWTEIGVWDVETAVGLANAGLTPAQATAVADYMRVNGIDPDERYVDADAIESICNGELPLSLFLEIFAQMNLEKSAKKVD